jgi:hypothetical protein
MKLICQIDLKIVVDRFKMIPPMGLGSWAAFTPCGDSAMVMGDIILTETSDITTLSNGRRTENILSPLLGCW